MSDTTAPYCLITGASRGIGAAIALRLASDGYDIVMNYRGNHAAAEAIANQIREVGREAELLPFDVTDRHAAKTALEGLKERRGAPWGIVVNAGIVRDGLLMWMSDEAWDEVIDASLNGFFNVVRPLIAAQLMARKGRVVTIASASGQMGNAGQVNYSAAKGGLIAATKALARESAKRKVTANCVAPGLIDTDLIRDLPLDRLLPAVPMNRIGTPDEVAHAVSFLIDPRAAYVTGQVIGVSGGLCM
jgi:3-oxoacyl-[acyl-carrier protein] reductase